VSWQGWRGQLVCSNNIDCRGLSDSDWALRDAESAFMAGLITVAQLEERVERALVEPPRRIRGTTVLR
jgi:hypothetical protein